MLTGRKAELDRQLEANEHEQQRVEYLIQRQYQIIKAANRAMDRLPHLRIELEHLKDDYKVLLEKWNKEGEDRVVNV